MENKKYTCNINHVESIDLTEHINNIKFKYENIKCGGLINKIKNLYNYYFKKINLGSKNDTFYNNKIITKFILKYNFIPFSFFVKSKSRKLYNDIENKSVGDLLIDRKLNSNI